MIPWMITDDQKTGGGVNFTPSLSVYGTIFYVFVTPLSTPNPADNL